MKVRERQTPEKVKKKWIVLSRTSCQNKRDFSLPFMYASAFQFFGEREPQK